MEPEKAIKSIYPKPLKPLGIELCIQHSVLDVLMPQIRLDGARVLTLGGELVATGVAEHVRMAGEFKAGELASSGDDVVDGAAG